MSIHHRMDLTLKTERGLMVSKFLGNEDLKMTIGAETSIANIVISSTCHIQHYILILSRSTLEAQMGKWYHYRRVEEVVDGQRRLEQAGRDQIQELKNSFRLMREKEVP